MEETKIEDLPFEVLDHIFYFLSPGEKLTAALVCKSFHLVANQRKFLSSMTVVFKDETLGKCDLNSFNISRYFTKFEFAISRTDNAILILLEKLKDQVASLKLNHCTFTQSLDLSLLSHLESLTILGALNNLKTSKNLLNVTRLSISVSQFTCRKLFFDFCIKMPKLQELVINCCNVQSSVTRSDILELHQVGSLNSLTSLCFVNSRISSREFFLSIATTPHMRLQKLKVTPCENHILRVIPIFLSLQMGLTSLDLSYSYFPDEYVIDLSSLLPNLHELILDGCCTLSDPMLEQIFQLRHLKKLDLGEFRIRNLAQKFQTSPHPPSLTLLVATLTDPDVPSLCDYCPNMQELNLSGSSELTDSSVTRLFQMKHLKKLGLGHCTEITEEGFLHALCGSRCSLKELDVRYCNVNNTFVQCAITLYRNLKEMDIRFCPKVTTGLKCVIADAESHGIKIWNNLLFHLLGLIYKARRFV